MSSIDADALASWLTSVQNYPASPQALQRIGGSVTALNKVEQALDIDTLFWTEPANMDSVLAAKSLLRASDE